MTIFGREIATSIVALVLGIVILALIVGFTVRSCDKRKSEAAQTRVERSQAEAQSNSAADAIATVERSGEASRASEELTRSNERQIRAAPGAGDRVNSGVDAAGRAALCRREAYRNDPRCRSVTK